jgi:hypothetical protein
MENIDKTEKPKTIPIDIPGREEYPKVFRRLDKNDFSKEEWEELCREEFNDNRFAEENGMDSIYWCPACKLGVCEIRGHD